MSGIREGLWTKGDDGMTPTPQEVTRMLTSRADGQREALDQLVPIVYRELHRLAEYYLRRERPDHTLQPTALVHEVYLRLIDQSAAGWQDRAHFLGIAANAMRQILVNHAISRGRVKRGGAGYKLPLEEAVGVAREREVDLVALDDALRSLAKIDARQSRIVELRFFGGLTEDEIAEVLGVSPITVKREWRTAKAWLLGQIQP